MIKLISAYLIKYLAKHYKIDKNNKTYWFVRWLAELIKDDTTTTSVLINVATFINDNTFLYNMYSDVYVIDNTVVLVTNRPGMWIGKGGETIDSLKELIESTLHQNVSIRLVEEVTTAKTTINGYIRVMNDY